MLPAGACLNAIAISVLLLKGHKAPVHRISLRSGYVIQRILVDGSGAIQLLDLLLKLCKLDEQLFLQHVACLSVEHPTLDCNMEYGQLTCQSPQRQFTADPRQTGALSSEVSARQPELGTGALHVDMYVV